MSVGLGLSRPCPWPNISDIGLSSITCFLDLQTRLTLSKVSHYFQEFLASEVIQRQFLAQQSFRPLLTVQESTFQQYARFQAMHTAHPSMVRYHTEFVVGHPTCVRITPDRSKMVVLCRNPCHIACYDLPSMNSCWKIRFADVNFGLYESRLRIGPDGKKLVFYDGHRTSDSLPIKPGLIVIDMQTGEQSLKFAQEEGNLYLFKMNPDGKSIDTISWREENKIKRWDLATGLCVQTFQKGDKIVLQISPDGKVAILESRVGSKNLEVWEVETNTIIQTLETDRTFIMPVWSEIEISQDNRIAVIWDSVRHALQIFDLTNGAFIYTLKGDTNDPIVFNYFRISPDGKFVVGGHGSSLMFFNLETKRIQKTRPCYAKINEDSVHVTPDGTGVVLGTDNSVEFWHFCELPEEHLTRMYNHLARLNKEQPDACLEMSPMLPKFVQDEIREISVCCRLSESNSCALYNATQVAFPAIQKHLERAMSLPKQSMQIASEAMHRILALPDPVKEVLCKNFCSIRAERFKCPVRNAPSIVFRTAGNCEFFIRDCLEAIQCTMREYRQKYPLLEKCLENFRKSQGTMALRRAPAVTACGTRSVENSCGVQEESKGN